MYKKLSDRIESLIILTEELSKSADMFVESLELAQELIYDLEVYLANNLNKSKKCRVCGGEMLPKPDTINGYLCINCGVLDRTQSDLFKKIADWNKLMTF